LFRELRPHRSLGQGRNGVGMGIAQKHCRALQIAPATRLWIKIMPLPAMDVDGRHFVASRLACGPCSSTTWFISRPPSRLRAILRSLSPRTGASALKPMGWFVQEVADGNDLALSTPPFAPPGRRRDRPSSIMCAPTLVMAAPINTIPEGAREARWVVEK